MHSDACLWLLSIRACAEKMEIGVNFVAETPNLDRVVEMSALTEALSKAFPDMTPDQYPWPTSHQGDTSRVRSSWPAPPKTRTSASAAQQALDRIRQAALPSARSQSPGFGKLSKQQQVGFCHASAAVNGGAPDMLYQSGLNGFCYGIGVCVMCITYCMSSHPAQMQGQHMTLTHSEPQALLILSAMCCKVVQSASDRWQPNSRTTAVTYTSTTHSGVSYRPLTASSRPFTADPLSPRAKPNSRQARPASAQESSSRRSVASLAGGLQGKATMSSDVLQSDTTHLQITRLMDSRGRRSVSPMSEGSSGATPSPVQTPCSVLSRPNTAGRGCRCSSFEWKPSLDACSNMVVDMQVYARNEWSYAAPRHEWVWWLQPMLFCC